MGGGIARKKRIDEDFVGIGFDVEAGMPEPLNFSCHAPDHLKLREGEGPSWFIPKCLFYPGYKNYSRSRLRRESETRYNLN